VKHVVVVAEVPDGIPRFEVRGLQIAVHHEGGVIGVGAVLPVRVVAPPDTCQAFAQLIKAGLIAVPVQLPDGQETWQRLEKLRFRLIPAPQPAGNGRKIILPGAG
jgi:hypothetical protein